MHNFKSIKIRNKLILLILLMALVPFCLILFSLIQERSRQLDEAYYDTAIHAEQSAKLITQISTNTELLLNTIARIPMVKSGDQETANIFLLDMLDQYPQYSSIFLVDKSGERWATTVKTSANASYSDRKYFINAISTGRFSSGEFAIGKVKKKPVFSFALPYRNSSGSIGGVAVATLELSSLKDILVQQYISSNLSVLILDHAGKILFHSTNSALEGTQEEESVTRKMQQSFEKTVTEEKWNKGANKKILSFKRLYLPGETSPYMFVRVEVEKEMLLKEPNRKFLLNFSVLLFSMILSLLISYSISKRFMVDSVDESEYRHKTLFETSPHGILYQNRDASVVTANSVAENLYGIMTQHIYESAEPDASPLFIHEDGTVYPPETHPHVEAFATGKTVSNCIIGVLDDTRSSGDMRTWLKISSIPMFRNRESKPYMVYSILEDITRERSLELDRREIEQKKLHGQKLESLGVMAGGIAHDFNNLLQSIIGNMEMAVRVLPQDSTASGYISTAMLASRHAADLTDLMLTYAGRGLIRKKRLDINGILKDNAEIFKNSIPANVSIKLSLMPELPYILADSGQIQQVVMNLITNASEAIDKEQGVVKIVSGVIVCDKASLAPSLLDEKPEPGEYVFIEVSDNGSGISNENRKRLFDPFFTTKFTGRGLGMSAVMGIIKIHGGAMFLDSELGKGTTFRALFPAAEKTSPVNVEKPADVAPQKLVTPAVHLSNVALIADDEKTVLKTCRKMVELCGFKVITACDGIEAVAKFREHADEITLVILDMTMPNKDGIAAMTEIFTIKPDAKVILSSGFNKDELSERITGQAPSGYVSKPYSMSALEEEIRKVTGNG